VVLALWIAVWVTVASYGASRYREGRRSVTASAGTVPVGATVARDADSTAQAHTDTVVRRIVVTRWRVDTLATAVPDTLQTVPQIRALIVATRALTAQVDTLARTIDIERAVSRMRASTDSAALAATALVIVQQQDQIVTLTKRPQWRTVAFAVGAGLVSGVLLRR
jgi:ElaB/YqjD/DUF883 family membrane-anchored ribosome-binding protein